MASPGNPNPDPLLQEAVDIAKRLASLRRELTSTADLTKNIAQEFKKTSAEFRTSLEISTEVKHALDDTRNIASKLGREYIDQNLIQGRIQENIVQSAFVQDELDIGLQKLNKTGADLDQLYKDIGDKLESNDKKIRKSVTAQEYAVFNLIKDLQSRKQIGIELDNIDKKLDQGNNKVKEATVKASALAKIFNSISGVPFLKDLMDFNKISDAFAISAKEGVRSLYGEIMRVVKSPLFLMLAGITAIIAAIKALFKAALEFDKQLTQISNNLGMAKEATRGLLHNFRMISEESLVLVKGLDSAFLSVKNQAAATAELQEILETNALFTSKMVQSQILLTKQMGLSKEEAAGIQKISILSGKSADEILENAVRQNKTAVSYRKIISDISKINSEISVMYKNNPDLINAAVIQANKLGMSLETTRQISKSLLDFESSIAGELEAELLTGQRFNFEKARALALDGKSVEAAKELVDQMGGLNGLTKLNVIQRERLANAIGLSSDELTKSAREAEILTKLGFENRKALEEQYALMAARNDQAGIAALKEQARKKEGGDILLQDIARANLQQRFEESLERIKQLFLEIGTGPITKLMNSITNLLNNATLLKGVMVVMAGLFAAIAAAAVTAAIAMTIAMGGANLAGAVIGGIAAVAAGATAYALFSGPSSGVSDAVTRPAPATREAPARTRTSQDLTSFAPSQDMSRRPGAQNRSTAVPTAERDLVATKTPAVPTAERDLVATKTPAVPRQEYNSASASVAPMSPSALNPDTRSVVVTKTPVTNPEIYMQSQNNRRDDTPSSRGMAFNDKPIVIQVDTTVEMDGIKVGTVQKRSQTFAA